MKRFLALACMLILIPQLSRGQTFFSFQWEVAEPTESLRKAAGTGFGVRGTYMYFVGSRVALTGTAGYMKWGPRVDLPGNEYKFVTVPVHLGIKFLLARRVVAPFVGVSFGMNYIRVRGIAPNSPTATYTDLSELKFGFSPQVGVGVFLAGPVGATINGSYNVIYTQDSPSKYFGLSLGLAVGF